MESKQLIKEAVKEMIRDGEITITWDDTCIDSRSDIDSRIDYFLEMNNIRLEVNGE